MQVHLQPAYILHSRSYKETSLLIDFLTHDYGRVHAIAKGAKRKSSGLLQPFVPLKISWTGRNELKTLTHIESGYSSQLLVKEWLYSALYLNEILIRLLRSDDPHPLLFEHYEQAMVNFANQVDLTSTLRQFEKACLAEIGYALPLHKLTIDPEKHYYYEPDEGFFESNSLEKMDKLISFPGRILHAIARDEYNDPDVSQAAKRLMRIALQPHIGSKPLQSRQFFRKTSK